MVPANSHRIPRVPCYSGVRREGCRFSHTRLSRSMVGLSRAVPLTATFVTPQCLIPRPRWGMPQRFRLFRVRSPLLTESLICFLFLGVLRWFTSLGLLSPPYVFRREYTSSACVGSPIRRPAGHWMLAPHRSFSQLATSFIASKCQGIHRVPLVA